MAKNRYAPDKGLQARMGLTMFLLGLVFVAFVALLWGILSASGASGGALIFFPVLLGIFLVGGSLFFSDKIALSTARATEISPEQDPRLHGIVDRLCALANVPKPRIYRAPTDMPNAFATGRSSKTAVLCVTDGLMRRLDDRELEGVIAHEMSHVAHKDVMVMTIASFIGIMAALLVRMAFYSELFGGFGGGRGGRGNNNQAPIAVIMLAMMVIGMVTYAVSFLLIRLLSRYRELAADRSGALLTGQPSALASALQKVSGSMAAIPTRDLRQAEPLSAFYFAPALKGDGHASIATIFSTHPSLERRLQQLAEISAQLGR